MPHILCFFLLLAVTLPAVSLADDLPREADSFDLLGAFPTDELALRIKAYQVRFSLFNGALRLTSSAATAGSDISSRGGGLGVRLELERWFQRSSAGLRRRDIGLVVDFQYLYMGSIKDVPGPTISQLPGPTISQVSLSAMFAWRVIGFGHPMPWRPEVTLLLGPAMEVMPLVSLFQDYTTYELYYTLGHPVVAGGRGGLRARFPLFTDIIAVEAAGYYMRPFVALGGDAGGKVLYSDTVAEGASLLLDLRISNGLDVGGGYYWFYSALSYNPPGSSQVNRATFYCQAFLASLRLSF